MAEDHKEHLLDLLLEKSFQYSPEPTFRLASGSLSNYYIDCRRATHSCRGKHLIGTIICGMLGDLDVQAVGGLTMGADPIACSVSYAAFLQGRQIASFSIRKEPKGHGLNKQVEGDVAAGHRVVIMEDVITTGGSTIKAVQAARNEGLVVLKVVALVDREEGGKKAIRQHVSDVEAVCTRTELMDRYRNRIK